MTLGNMAQDVMLAIDADVTFKYDYDGQIDQADWKEATAFVCYEWGVGYCFIHPYKGL